MFTANEIRDKYMSFFKNKNHSQISSVSLLPENDPTLLFVNSGMFPLVQYLLGEKHPQGNRLVNHQRCFRTDDIEEVGDHRHTTYFEMLGNWSLGDYFKKEQINYWYEFLFEALKIDPKRIYQSVYAGDKKAPIDKESISILQDIFQRYGVSVGVGESTTGKGDLGTGKEIDFEKYRIFPYRDKNWRQRGEAIGEVGGPDTETFYNTGKSHDKKYGEYCHVNCDCGRFIEIGNSVFIQYILKENGREEIENKNVDFGGGLERITMVANNYSNMFEIDLFKPYIKYIEKKTGIKYVDNTKAFEVIIDHLRASTLLIMDGCLPSNKDQGYYLRRLIRRILVQTNKLDLSIGELAILVDLIIEKIKESYHKLGDQKQNIINIIMGEAEKFDKVLRIGLKYFEESIQEGFIFGKDVFKLQATHGLPYDVILDLGEQRGIKIDKEGYKKELEKHKEVSRQGADKKFKSGLADSSEETIKYHTATHLLHASLKKILGDHVEQKGSNITPERLRFDFSHSEKMTTEQKEAVENDINNIIQNGFIVKKEEVSVQGAKSSGAIGLFDNKYEGNVSVFTVIANDGTIISKEICTGPHVESSEGMGIFKIKKESSSSGGIRRIKAVLI